MLYSLSVSNYILISSLETTFPEGLIIISGETGAGKSILLGALSLVLGAKADARMVVNERGIEEPMRFQFERMGYFCTDRDSTPEHLVFNRACSLKDTWAKISQG